MSNGRKVERYAYRKVDEPLIKTPAGEFATVHYERVTEDANENKAQLWLARDRIQPRRAHRLRGCPRPQTGTDARRASTTR